MWFYGVYDLLLKVYKNKYGFFIVYYLYFVFNILLLLYELYFLVFICCKIYVDRIQFNVWFSEIVLKQVFLKVFYNIV